MITWRDNTKLSHDEWVFGKLETLGASEGGAIVHGNQYTSSLEIFWQKIGAYKPPVTNIRAFLGLLTEDPSEQVWKYYENNDDSVSVNYRLGRQIKDCENRKATCFNTDYPHLSATPDRIIKPFGIYSGRGEGCLEMKNTQSFILKGYLPGLPPDNVFQLVIQNMLAGFDYGELFYFKDNRSFESHCLERKDCKNIEEIVLSKTIPFWENVKKARPIYNQMFEARRNSNQKLADECQREIESLEPPPQNTSGYLNFLSQKYKDRLSGTGVIIGKEEHRVVAKKHQELASKIKSLEEEKRRYEIELKNIIGNMSCIDFGKKSGKVTWYESEKGTRIFKNSIK